MTMAMTAAGRAIVSGPLMRRRIAISGLMIAPLQAPGSPVAGGLCTRSFTLATSLISTSGPRSSSLWPLCCSTLFTGGRTYSCNPIASQSSRAIGAVLLSQSLLVLFCLLFVHFIFAYWGSRIRCVFLYKRKVESSQKGGVLAGRSWR